MIDTPNSVSESASRKPILTQSLYAGVTPSKVTLQYQQGPFTHYFL